MLWKTSQNSSILSKGAFKHFTKLTEKHLSWSLFFNEVTGWKPKTVRNNHWRCSGKKGILKNFVNFTRKNLCRRHFLIKLDFWEFATLLNKTPTQMLSCEICEIFKNNYFEEHLWTTVSKPHLKRDSNTDVIPLILWIMQEHLFCRASTNGWFCKPVRGSLFNKVASLTAWRPF